jgi:hypothetical protein
MPSAPHRPSVADSDVEAAVRAYVARVARRYFALLVAAIALVLVVVTVPTKTPNDNGSQALGVNNGLQGTTGSSLGSGAGTGQAGGLQNTASGSATGSGGSGGGAAASGAGLSSGSQGGSSRPGATTAASGLARSGVKCGPGVRQVTWSAYAPNCVPKYTGSNGGATAPGVTAKTITLSFRLGNSQEDAAVNAAAGSSAPAPDPVFIADMNTYISYFNKQYELYGRQVVLKSFQGQGDYITEDQGQGADLAQADAATAKSLGAFADATFALKGSDPYWRALAQQHVIAIGPLGYPQSYYQQYAPYWWSASATGTMAANWFINATCQRLAGMNAIYAPDKTMQVKKRVFGLIHPDNPQYISIANDIKKGVGACGVTPKEASYSINVVQYQAQATNIVAQMRSAGVTTVLCYCDPLVPIFLENAAQSQQYNPEWISTYWGDPQARQPASGKWGGLIAMGGASPDLKQTEAYKVFKLASGGAEPREQYYAVAYATVLYIMNALQAAGPDLTPAAFARGMFSLPPSADSFMGRWTYGNNKYSPATEVQIGWYDPNMTSKFDGQKGGYRNCAGGQEFLLSSAQGWGGPGQQLGCFGK